MTPAPPPASGGKLRQTDPKVQYTPTSPTGSKCQWCQYFQSPSACAKVAGPISLDGYCLLFQPGRADHTPALAGLMTPMGMRPPGLT